MEPDHHVIMFWGLAPGAPDRIPFDSAARPLGSEQKRGHVTGTCPSLRAGPLTGESWNYLWEWLLKLSAV